MKTNSCGILHWIQEQKKAPSGKTYEIQVKTIIYFLDLHQTFDFIICVIFVSQLQLVISYFIQRVLIPHPPRGNV